ncbi:7-carboxy-7-deazaguanine synthase QueE [soil metagenome]
MTRLRIAEIFYSLQGETNTVGLPTVFIRLTGCPLRCNYCDTAYAFHGGQLLELAAILTQVASYGTHYVTVTGGEPLAQKPCLELLQLLCDQGYEVSLETSGALDVSAVDPRVIKILDLKTPGSGEVERNDYNNLHYLNAKDQIKIVICDRKDYEWAKAALTTYQLPKLCQVLFSPSYQQLHPQQLANWMLVDKLPVRFQLQLHKYIWGDVAGK